MITLNKYKSVDGNRIVCELVGLSTDTKPIERIENFPLTNGSTLLEMDTSNVFIYDQENNKWVLL